jgi:hypothetical protein
MVAKFYRHKIYKHLKVQTGMYMSFRTKTPNGASRYSTVEFCFLKPDDQTDYHNGIAIRPYYRWEIGRFLKHFEKDITSEVLYGKNKR